MKNKHKQAALAEKLIRGEVRKVLKESHFTPGSNSALFEEETRLNEFHGILEQINYYSKKFGKKRFDVLDELMSIVESSTLPHEGSLGFKTGDFIKMTWVNEGVTREDVIVTNASPSQLRVRIVSETDEHTFIQDEETNLWNPSEDSEDGAEDPVEIEKIDKDELVDELVSVLSDKNSGEGVVDAVTKATDRAR